MVIVYEDPDKLKITYDEETRRYSVLVVTEPSLPKIAGVGLHGFEREDMEALCEVLRTFLYGL